jgi:hypothetical protein
MAWIPIKDLGQGLNLDSSPEELAVGVASGGSNVRYRQGYAERFKGLQSFYNAPPAIPYHVTTFAANASRFIVYAGLAKTYVDDGTTQTEITNADNTGAIDDRWCGFSFNGIYVQNNGVDVPQYWNGNVASNLADLTGWPSGYRVGFMRPFKNYLVAGDVTRSGVRERGTFLWSHQADPGTIPTSWDITDASLDAGDIPLAETDGTLIDALPMGDMLAIYKDDALHYAQLTGNASIFRFGRLPGETGMLARGCVAQIPGAHIFLTSGIDLVVHSGQGLKSLLTGRMRTWLGNEINPDRATRSFIVTNPKNTEALLCFPSGSSETCDKALVWNWQDNTFSVRDLPNVTYGTSGPLSIAGALTWTTLTGTWDTLPYASWTEMGGSSDLSRLLLCKSGKFLLFDATEQDDGSDFTAMVELKGLHFDSPETMKLCRGVRPKFDADQGAVIKVQIGAAATPDAEPSWQPAVDFTVGTDIEAHSFASGRFHAVRFFTTDDTAWRLRSCQLDMVMDTGAY